MSGLFSTTFPLCVTVPLTVAQQAHSVQIVNPFLELQLELWLNFRICICSDRRLWISSFFMPLFQRARLRCVLALMQFCCVLHVVSYPTRTISETEHSVQRDTAPIKIDWACIHRFTSILKSDRN